MGKYFFLDTPVGVYSTPWDVEGGSLSDRVKLAELDCGVIYEIFDDLVERYPDYVSRTDLGEVEGYRISRYTFSPMELENKTGFEMKRFKMLITSAVHGSEKGSAWTVAQAFRLMCDNPDDPVLGFLRRNVVFEVIPVVNPWGFAQNTRKNANGVDLNRNYEPFFMEREPESSEYGGAHPGSETETKIMMQFLEENTDAEYFLDCHNKGKGYPLYYVATDDVLPLAQSVFTALSHKWVKEYPQLPKNRLLGRIGRSDREGMIIDFAGQLGMNTFTVEVPCCMPEAGTVKFDHPTIRCSIDLFINTVAAIVKSYR